MIKTNTLVHDYDYVSQFDEAVDKSGEDFEQKWKQYRDGMSEPPLLPGATPTIFKLRHVTSVEHAYLLELRQSDEHGFFVAAAALALVGIKGLAGENGKPVTFRKESTQVGPVRLQHAAKETLDALPIEVLLELGVLAMERVAVRPS